MAVNIDPSEVRDGRSSVKVPAAAGRFRLPLRAVLIGGVGGAGLIAFSVCAFSFFSDLADPRARTVRMAPVASQWPDLKDGVPALADDARAPPATINLPRPAAVTAPASAPEAAPQRTAAIAPPAQEPPREEPPREEPVAPPLSPAPVASSTPPAAAPAVATAALPAPLPIRNAPTVEEEKTVPVVAPARTAAALAPARTETVKARTGQPGTFVSLEPKASAPEPEAQAAVSPAPKPEKPAKAAAREKPEKKISEKKTAARRTASAKSEDETGAAPAPAASAAPEDDIPGARQLRDGFKAIGGLFGKSDSE